MPSLHLRDATPADVPAIHDLHVRAILGLGPTAYSAQESASWAAGLTPAHYHDAMTTQGERYLLAEKAGQAAGFCSFKEAQIIGLYVDPDRSRQGIGTALITAAETALTQAGPVTLRLTAALSAVAFYQAQGYRVTKRKLWGTRGGAQIEVCDMSKAAPR